MIKYSESKTQLLNLKTTLEAVETLEYLIEKMSQDLPGPAYVVFANVAKDHSEIQIDRGTMLTALKSQRVSLCVYLQKLGIDINS